MFQQEQYEIAKKYFTKSIAIQEEKIYEGEFNGGYVTEVDTKVTLKDLNEEISPDWFILACRFFNRGLAKLAIVQEQLNSDDFEEREQPEYDYKKFSGFRKSNPMREVLMTPQRR